MLRLVNLLVAVVFLMLGTSLSRCGSKAPEKDEATLQKEAQEQDKKVKDGESGL